MSSILDLSVSRGTAADTSSARTSASSPSRSRRSPFTPPRDHDDAARAVTTTDLATPSAAAADTDDKELTISSQRATSGDVTDDVGGSRDRPLRHRSRDRSQPFPPYLDYQAAAAAAARFLVPFPFPSPAAAAATGSAPMTSPLSFYPLSFPAMQPPPPDTAGLYGATEAGSASAGRSRSTEMGVTVKDECGGGGVTSPGAAEGADPTYAERRRKNNEAARRSRDARRMKERETSLRAALLQQENVRLRAEMAVLKTEIARLHCLLYDKM